MVALASALALHFALSFGAVPGKAPMPVVLANVHWPEYPKICSAQTMRDFMVNQPFRRDCRSRVGAHSAPWYMRKACTPKR